MKNMSQKIKARREQANAQRKPSVDPDAPAQLLDLSKEGICPKSGVQMQKVKLTACSTPQYVWFAPETRVSLPMKNAEKL